MPGLLSRRPLLFVLGVLVAFACDRGGGAGRNAAIEGSLAVPADSSIVAEVEPNDSVDQAHPLGVLEAGRTLTIVGRLSRDRGDARDAFSLATEQRVEILASLTFADASADLDIALFDPVSGQFIETFSSAANPEIARFHAKGSFDLVLAAVGGETDYELILRAVVVDEQDLSEREPNDMPLDAQFLGEMRGGDRLDLGGVADAGIDPVDLVLVSLPFPARVDLQLGFPGSADFDLIVRDATGDVGNPIEIARAASTDNPEGLSLSVATAALLQIEVRAAGGSGAYRLSIDAGPYAAGARDTRPVLTAILSDYPGGGTGIRAELDPYRRPVRDVAPFEAIVSLRDPLALDAWSARAGVGVLARVPGGPALVGLGAGGDLDPIDGVRRTLALVRRLATVAGVRYVEVNHQVRGLATPNDELYALQWNYPMIQMPSAWDITRGRDSVIVAVLDSGRTPHVDLAGRQSAGGFDFVSDARRSGDGDGIDPDPTDPGDEGGSPGTFHGTHVAGIIAASTDNGRGVAGVTWEGRLQHLRVIGSDGSGTNFDLANAILYAAGLPNSSMRVPSERAQVVNMSLGGFGSSRTVEDAVTAARDAGIVLIAAAGNEDSGEPVYPAAYDGVVSVGAVSIDARRAPYSSFGPTVDLAAPGGDLRRDLNGDGFADGILSTVLDDRTVPPSSRYVFYNGTSMACAHVSGVAALLLSVHPTLTPTALESVLATTARDLGPLGRDDDFGDGLVDAYRAVLLASRRPGGAPLLAVSTRSVNFGRTRTTFDVQIANAGGGFLEVGPVHVTTDRGDEWLGATLLGSRDPATSADVLRVTASRAGLPLGDTRGRIRIESNGGTLDLQVLLSVPRNPGLPDVDLFVVAVRADTMRTVAGTLVDPTTSTAFRLDRLPPGEYFVFAGSDDNEDGLICGPGDRLCGAFPVFSQPTAIRVAAKQTTGSIDFAVAEIGLVPMSADATRGIAVDAERGLPGAPEHR